METAHALDAGTSANREALIAGLAFLEGSAAPGWSVGDLRAWFSEHLIRPGYMMTPLLVTEPSAGTVPLYRQLPASTRTLQMILVAARSRILSALRGLTDSPQDDRFLTASIFAGRVSRQRVQGASRWVARPEPTMPLSGVVLSLFAVDALSHREIYNQLLSVCDTCNRVTFHDGGRRSCPEHMLHMSGFIRKVAIPLLDDGRDHHVRVVLGDAAEPLKRSAQALPV